MDILVKASGDVIGINRFYEFLKSFTRNNSKRLFILCGGGTEITEKLKKENIGFHFGPAGREIKSTRGIILAYQVLEEQKEIVERRLKRKGIKGFVFIPSVGIGNKICHLNADNYALGLSPNFEKIFIVTLKGRNKSFPNFSKIKVIYL